jgi:NAD(P)-dependent dehydrogenase (short-subunit alcohol dehydrogenase family)
MTHTVLITGSSSGIGQATAQLFAQRGLECRGHRPQSGVSGAFGGSQLACAPAGCHR